MVKETDFLCNGQKVSYEINDDGYNIFLGGRPWFSQPEPYIPYPDLGYEGSCLKQIEELCTPPEPPQETAEEKMAALEAQVQSLTDCILEMSGMLYA